MSWLRLIHEVAANAEVTQREAERVSRILFIAIGRAVRNGQRIDVPGFGVFDERRRKARRIRNVLDGAEVDLPAETRLGFRPSRNQKRKGNR